MIKWTIILVLLLQSIAVFAQLPTQNESRNVSSFNSDWKFVLEDNNSFSEPEYDDSSWRILNLPHDWSIEGEFDESNPAGPSGAYLPCGIAWYRKSFHISESVSSQKVFIRFDGVYMNSKVWINGHMLGLRPFGYVGFQYDISSFLNFGDSATNVLAVQVDNSLQPGSRWYSGSGIYRNTWLIVTNPMHFTKDGVFVKTINANRLSATLEIDYKVQSNVFKESKIDGYETQPDSNIFTIKKIIVESVLKNNEGNVVAQNSSNTTISDLTKKGMSNLLKVTTPDLWSAESPTIYQLHSALICDGKTIDSLSTPVGIRTVEYSIDQGLLVNGISTKLKGVCLHHGGASFGAAVPIGLWELRLNQFKTLGANAIRVSHYPFAPEFYDLCDQMGFYIMEDTFDEWRYGYHPGVSEDNTGKREYGYHMFFDQWAETDLKEMIINDRNHPSIIMYCLGNEVVDQKYKDGVETLVKLKKIAHSTDPTRLSTVGCDFSAFANLTGFMDSMDIAGYNYADRYHGEDMYTPDREKYPNRMFIGTETYTNPECWIGIKDKPWVMGEFLWAGIDYLGEAWKWPNRSITCSLIDLAGFKKPIYFNRKSHWNNDPIVYLAVQPDSLKPNDWKAYDSYAHWNWTNDTRDSLTVYAFSNCDQVKLLLNDEELGTYTPNKYHVITTKIKYVSGSLKAIAFNSDKQVANHELISSGKATSLNLKKYAETTRFSQKLVQLEINAVDNNGVLVFEDESQIEVTITGGGTLLGLDSGNSNSSERYKIATRKLFEGKAMATILIKENAKVKVSVSSSLFKTQSIKLHN